ncbi:MAG: Ribosomal small subunit pseudouridine synthase A [Candidatus Celerinatantimonas neptuna]|nr:MAG: Ribosomal small subunit pseudouridine synthase A [Candidatus Celerinatantimonas neptuna]
MTSSIRLDKFISHSNGSPRSLVKQYLRAGRIQVNEHIEKQGKRLIHSEDRVTLDGQIITEQTLVYLMMNKPLNYVSTRHDSTHPSALELVREYHHPQLHIAGRLDADTSGLLLLTNDGQWSHQITAPGHHKWKHYLVTLAEPLSSSACKQLENGMMLRNESKPTLPAKVIQQQDNVIQLMIQEGRYHQVKRMMAAVKNHVIHLHRDQIGNIKLDIQLAPGEYRHLSEQEKQIIIEAN